MARDKDDDGEGRLDLLSSHHRPKGLSALAEVEAHWRELKDRAGHLPRRADLDASRIVSALPHAFILERVAPGVARLRIAGQALSALLGTEARGLPLSVFFTPVARDKLRRWVERCFDAPALVDLPIEAQQGVLRAPLTGRLLLLPMLDGDGGITRAFGGLFLDGTKRASIVKLDLSDAPGRCEPIATAGPAIRAVAAGTPSVEGFAEPGRPHLRLVVDNS